MNPFFKVNKYCGTADTAISDTPDISTPICISPMERIDAVRSCIKWPWLLTEKCIMCYDVEHQLAWLCTWINTPGVTWKASDDLTRYLLTDHLRDLVIPWLERDLQFFECTCGNWGMALVGEEACIRERWALDPQDRDNGLLTYMVDSYGPRGARYIAVKTHPAFNTIVTADLLKQL